MTRTEGASLDKRGYVTVAWTDRRGNHLRRFHDRESCWRWLQHLRAPAIVRDARGNCIGEVRRHPDYLRRKHPPWQHLFDLGS